MEPASLTAYVTIFGALLGVSIIYLRFYVGRELTGVATSIRTDMARGFERLRSDLRGEIAELRRDVMTREVATARLDSIEWRLDHLDDPGARGERGE